MSVDDVYNYYDQNWSRAMRDLGFGVNTYQNWIKNGYIPIATQRKIENITTGRLKADYKQQ
jgi:hypothetical protein